MNMKWLKQDKKGMTLVELIVATVLGTTLITIAVMAIGVTFRICNRSTALSEGGILRSTLYHAIADELRYAALEEEISGPVNALRYLSPLHGGREITMTLDGEGYLSIDGQPALSRSVYAGYRITDLFFMEGPEDCIVVTFTLTNGIYDIQGETTRMVVRCLN